MFRSAVRVMIAMIFMTIYFLALPETGPRASESDAMTCGIDLHAFESEMERMH